jgi:hypothetical protein
MVSEPPTPVSAFSPYVSPPVAPLTVPFEKPVP